MSEFTYKLCFSPYSCTVKARNLIHAKKILREMYPEYNMKEVLQYLTRRR